MKESVNVFTTDAEMCESFAAAVDEIIHRAQAGETVDMQAYYDRYPDRVEQLKELLPTMQLLVGLNEDTAITDLPERIGRYRIQSVLGKGGFGLVYLAQDEQLDRPVAVKVPHAYRVSKPEDAEAYLTEARTVANLDHPGIVPVHDVGSTEDCPCFIVSKYIPGTNLSTKIKHQRLKHREAAQLVAAVAEALHYAHMQGFIHLDVKPGNILIGNDGKPYVVDFGLALREENIGKGFKYAGTPAYMSPEQALGEGHRVDRRSDIFSLGIVFYELLTGGRPFLDDQQEASFAQLPRFKAKPVRHFGSDTPKELERICYKSIAQRVSERYSTAKDFAEDLWLFLQEQTVAQSTKSTVGITSGTAETLALKATSASTASGNPGSSDSQPIKIVPKGLRSFDAHDADFFLELLPGPRDRDGLPDSLRFWKTRIEEVDPDDTFSVGLIYGPSGCGKSSLVKAGLLPRLSNDVIPVYIEATPEQTEARLLHGLRKRCPALPGSLSLKDTLAAIRRGQGVPVGQKVLIVLDQFEQWLHATNHAIKEEDHSELVQALRQCDGGRVQCIVMVREDFWMATTRFMRDLEVPLLDAQNSAAVDLFHIRHAEKVLAAFGRAFDALPDKISDVSNEQKSFITESVAGLTEEGKVICVRLALFAEMMKEKAWTPQTLKAVGGTQGIGVAFLEETFTASTSPPENRFHQEAVRAVLRNLLPDTGANIKGRMRSYAELLEVSGYGNRPKDFDQLIQILDREIRLITPTEPEGKDADNDSVTPPQAGQKYFQLTHDYLVHSLRDWLTRKQKETRKGRTELKLEERSASWNAKRENKQLPTTTEWLGIRVLTDSKRWTGTQRAMMGKAARVHGALWGGLLLTVLLIGTGIQQGAWVHRRSILKEQVRAAAESSQNSLGNAVPVNLRELEKLPTELVLMELRTRFISATDANHKLSLAFALAGYGELDADYLVSRIDDITEADIGNYVTAIQANSATALAALKDETSKCTKKSMWRRKVKLSIVALGLGDTEFASDVCTYENRPDPEQRTLFIDQFPKWAKWEHGLRVVLDAVRNSDNPALRSGICLGVGQMSVEKVNNADRESWKLVASKWFVEQNDTSTHSAAGWLLRQWKIPLPEVPSSREITPQRDWFINSVGSTLLRIRPETSVPDAEFPDPLERYREDLVELGNASASELTNSAVRLKRGIAHFETGDLDRALEDLDFLINHRTLKSTQAMRYRALALARTGKTDEAKQALASYLSQGRGNHTFYIQILVPAWLGDTAEALQELETAISSMLMSNHTLSELYDLACAAGRCAQITSSNDAGRSQQFTNRAIELLGMAVSRGSESGGGARKDPHFAILHGDARFASLLAEMEKHRKIRDEVWVGACEVTRGQFEQFLNDGAFATAEEPVRWEGMYTDVSPTVDHPAQGVSWFDAILYCNWLSLREGLKPCYERTATKNDVNHWDYHYAFNAWRQIPGASGYRLLHSAEWEYAGRAGALTKFSSGDDDSSLAAYSQFSSEQSALCGEKLPNALGLHDFHGNVSEWCWDPSEKIGTRRVNRGGHFGVNENPWHWFEHRDADNPTMRSCYVGFRIARGSGPAQSVAKGWEAAGRGTESAFAERRSAMP